MKKRIVSMLLALTLLLGLLPATAFAAQRDPSKDQVRVIVENTTYTVADGAPWDGTLVDTWVDLDPDSSIASCLVAALDEYGYTQSGAESNYVGEIHGISQFQGTFEAGWMVTLNDWFINEGVGAFTVADGKLEPGDEIKIMYSCYGYGADIGGDWSNNDKTVQALQFSTGTLDKAFSSDVHEYVLTVPAGTTGVVVTPTASNKNFQVRVSDEDGKEYKRNDTIPVTDGCELIVTCGDPSWPTMNSGDYGNGSADSIPAEEYIILVSMAAAEPDLFITVDLTEYEGTMSYAVMLADDLDDPDNSLFDEDSIVAGESTRYSFSTTVHDLYIVDLCIPETDTSVLGWNVNGTDYLIADSAENEDYWALANDCGVGYSFGVGEDNDETEFYLILGVADVYTTPGTWVIKPVLGPDQAVAAVIEAIDAIGTVSLEKESAITAARTAYDSLSDAQKEQVTNLSTLTAAEQLLSILKLPQPNVDDIYKDTGDYLAALAAANAPVVSSTGGEWLVLGLARSGRAVPEGYYTNVVSYVNANVNDKGQLHSRKSTDNSRVILALTAAGYDVTDVNGHNLLLGLSDYDYTVWLGINAAVFGLIAFDSADYDIPTVYEGGVQNTREKLIAYILSKQLADGGWALSTYTTADVDVTAMTVQSLAPYYSTNADVKAAVDKALALLSQRQNSRGGFGSYDGACSESAAQVIVALTALGIDPDTDSRFVKNSRSVVDALCEFYIEDQGFKHLIDGNSDLMATEQAYYALAAYARFKAGQTSLYDMTDVELPQDIPPAGNPNTGDLLDPMLLCAALTFCLLALAALSLTLKKKAF